MSNGCVVSKLGTAKVIPRLDDRYIGKKIINFLVESMSSYIRPMLISKGSCIQGYNHMSVSIIPMFVLGKCGNYFWHMQATMYDAGPDTKRDDK